MMRNQASPKEIQTLRAMLKRLGPQRNLYFVYFDQGEDGAPFLMVDKKKIPPSTVQTLAARARKKRPVRGHISQNTESRTPDFYPIKAPGKLQKALRTFFRRVPELQGARVVLRDDADLVAERLADAEEERIAAEDSEQVLAREAARLRSTLALLEQKEAEADFEMADAQQALDANWLFWKKRALQDSLEEAEARSGKRKADLAAAREALAAKQAELVQAEQKRLLAEEEAADLSDLWSAIQTQEWEHRRNDSASWREDFQAQMQRLDLVSGVSDRLQAEVKRCEDARLARQAELSGLLAAQAQGDNRKETTQRVNAARISLVALENAEEKARQDAWSARDQRMQAEEARNKVFMTEDERSRAEVTRISLLEAQAQQIATGGALDAALAAEKQAHVGLDDIQKIDGEVASLRQTKARLQLEIMGLEGRASQWTWFRSSRQQDKAAAAEALAEKRALLEDTTTRLELATAVREDVEREAGATLEAAKAATTARLAAEAKHLAAKLEVGRWEQEIAEESATILEWHTELRRQELNRLLESDAVMRREGEARDFRQAAADTAVSALVEEEAELAAQRDRHARLTRDLAASSHADADETHEVAELSRQIAARSRALEDQRRKAELVVRRAEEAEALYQSTLRSRADALRQGGDSALVDAIVALDRAEAELSGAAEADVQALEERDLLRDQLTEAGRQEAVHALVLDGQAMAREFSEVFEALRDKDLFESRDVRAVKKAVGPAVEEIQSQLDAHASEMIQAGATASELASVFERVPNGLRPAAYRKEVGAVDELMRRFDLLEAEKAQDKRDQVLIRTATETTPEEHLRKIREMLSELDKLRQDAKYLPLQGAGKLSAASDWLNVIGILDADSTDAKTLGAISTFLWQLNTGLGAMGAVGDAAAALSAKNADGDPVLQKLQDKQRLDAISGLVTAGLDVTRHIVPLVALPWLGKGFVDNVVKAAARTYRAQVDSKLKALARLEGSELAGPLEESMGHEWRLAEKYGFSAASSAAWIAAVVLGMGPSASISFAIAVTAKSTGIAHDLLTSTHDWKLARKANALLERARAGDPRAKSELLKNHGRYAKGLLALKAQEGDPFAMQYVASRGLEESDIRASSFDIITRYLLSMSEQSDSDHQQTFTDWVAERRASFGRLAGIVVKPLRYAWATLVSWFEAPGWNRDVELPPVDLALDTAAEMVALIRDGEDLRGRLSARELPPDEQAAQEETVRQLDALLAEQHQQARGYWVQASDQLEDISGVEARFKAQLLKPLELDRDEKRTLLEVRSRVLRARREHLLLLNTLSEIA